MYGDMELRKYGMYGDKKQCVRNTNICRDRLDISVMTDD